MVKSGKEQKEMEKQHGFIGFSSNVSSSSNRLQDVIQMGEITFESEESENDPCDVVCVNSHLHKAAHVLECEPGVCGLCH